jgi:hypothetical protein
MVVGIVGMCDYIGEYMYVCCVILCRAWKIMPFAVGEEMPPAESKMTENWGKPEIPPRQFRNRK